MAKTDRCVVRNQAYTSDKVGNMERHNERKNEHYGNGDVDLSRSGLNVHFKQCEGSYLQAFDQLLANGTISMKNIKKDGSAKIIDEFIFDVNTEYFEKNGGYNYAKSFFEEVYRLAVKEAGGDEFILSAVMHADERNKALSEKYGRNIYHYHAHIVYIPVVDKDVLWTTRCKDPALIGTVKEVIKQVSNSKKWASQKVMGKGGKERLIYSYSQLQDRYFEHMKNAGFVGFERGDRGSTAEHLDVLDYKIQQETERAAAISALVEEKQEAAVALDAAIDGKERDAAILEQKTAKKQKQLDGLKEKTALAKQEAANFGEIEKMVKPSLLGGNLQISPADWKKISVLAKEGIKSRTVIVKLKDKIAELLQKISGIEKRLEGYEGKGITDTMKYYQALQRAPRRLLDTVADVFRKPPEQERTHNDRNLARKNDFSH